VEEGKGKLDHKQNTYAKEVACYKGFSVLKKKGQLGVEMLEGMQFHTDG